MLTRQACVARTVAAAALALGLLGQGHALASGQPTCQVVDQKKGTCLVEITSPSTEATSRPVVDQDPRGATQCLRMGQPTACSDSLFGSWSNSLQCYIARTTPQPPGTDSVWAGNYPTGAIYDCMDTISGPFSKGAQLWLPSPPTNALSPEQAAETVVRRMDLRAADIGIVPEDKPGSIGAVGAPVYMWTTPGPVTFGPQTLTGSAGGVTITATAKVDRIVWTMGDGNAVTCRTPGTVYEDRYGFAMSPDCGYRYTRTSAGRPGNAYRVTATSYWLVNWTGPAGSSGQIPLTLTSSTSIVVGELQALVTR